MHKKKCFPKKNFVKLLEIIQKKSSSNGGFGHQQRNCCDVSLFSIKYGKIRIAYNCELTEQSVVHLLGPNAIALRSCTGC